MSEDENERAYEPLPLMRCRSCVNGFCFGVVLYLTLRELQIIYRMARKR